jgi:hypothetical protein
MDMEIVQYIGAGTSVIGCLIAIWTLLRVGSLRRAIGNHSVRRKLDVMFQEIGKVPAAKRKITDSQRREVEQILKYIDMFYLSWAPWKHGSEKKLTKKVREELDGEGNVQNIKSDLELLRDQVMIQG